MISFAEGVLGSVYNMYNSDVLCQIVDTKGRTGREDRGGRMSKKTRENPPTDSCPPAGGFYESKIAAKFYTDSIISQKFDRK